MEIDLTIEIENDLYDRDLKEFEKELEELVEPKKPKSD